MHSELTITSDYILMEILTWSQGKTRKPRQDRIRTGTTGGKAKVTPINSVLTQKRLSWDGHNKKLTKYEGDGKKLTKYEGDGNKTKRIAKDEMARSTEE